MADLILTPTVYKIHTYQNEKFLGRSRNIKLDTLKQIRKASGTSVFSIILSALYSALYKAHKSTTNGTSQPMTRAMHAACISAMLPYAEDEDSTNALVNQFTMWLYSSPLKLNSGDDPIQRLLHTNKIYKGCTTSPYPVFDFHITRALGALPEFAHWILYRLSGTPLMISNLPGLTTPAYMYDGMLVDAAAWIPLVTTTGN